MTERADALLDRNPHLIVVIDADWDPAQQKIDLLQSDPTYATIDAVQNQRFVGLMIPHIVRMIVGTDHRRVLPVAALAGSIFLVWVDVIARTAFAPEELPVGVITALLGGPFFAWLLYTRRKVMRDSMRSSA